jgi:hypothetical protein
MNQKDQGPGIPERHAAQRSTITKNTTSFDEKKRSGWEAKGAVSQPLDLKNETGIVNLHVKGLLTAQY